MKRKCPYLENLQASLKGQNQNKTWGEKTHKKPQIKTSTTYHSKYLLLDPVDIVISDIYQILYLMNVKSVILYNLSSFIYLRKYNLLFISTLYNNFQTAIFHVFQALSTSVTDTHLLKKILEKQQCLQECKKQC